MSRKSALLVAVWLLATNLPARADGVERVVVEAEGISVACRPGLEAALKSMDSIYKYAISAEKQMFSVTYDADQKFDPKKLRWAADKGEAEVLRMHVSAVGKIEKDGDRLIFASGEDRFEIVDKPDAPVGVTVGIVGVADDTTNPMQLKPDDVKVLTDEDLPKASAKSDSKPAHGSDEAVEPAKGSTAETN